MFLKQSIGSPVRKPTAFIFSSPFPCPNPKCLEFMPLRFGLDASFGGLCDPSMEYACGFGLLLGDVRDFPVEGTGRFLDGRCGPFGGRTVRGKALISLSATKLLVTLLY